MDINQPVNGTKKIRFIYKGRKADIEYEDPNEYYLDIGYSESLDKLHPDLKWIHIEVGSYQGDIISLGVDKKGNFYYKNNSYGSCSGCDWVQGINNKDGAEEFFKHQEILDSIGTDKLKVIEYLTNETKNVYDFEKEHLNKLIEFINKN